MDELAITVVGHDRPGIVAGVAEVLAGLSLNLTDSTMTRLRGHFAMTLVCTDGTDRDEVAAALQPLCDEGSVLATVWRVQPERERPAAGTPYLVSVHGADRLGIVAAVTRVLAQADGNITDLTTRLIGPLYVLVAEVDLPPGAEDDVRARLASAAEELGVEITVRPGEADVL